MSIELNIFIGIARERRKCKKNCCIRPTRIRLSNVVKVVMVARAKVPFSVSIHQLDGERREREGKKIISVELYSRYAHLICADLHKPCKL